MSLFTVLYFHLAHTHNKITRSEINFLWLEKKFYVVVGDFF